MLLILGITQKYEICLGFRSICLIYFWMELFEDLYLVDKESKRRFAFFLLEIQKFKITVFILYLLINSH